MKIEFYKYSGAGNDFIIIENDEFLSKFDSQICIKLCTRRKNIGADGVIFITQSSKADIKMRVFNADDGLEAEMCANGARCLVWHVHNIKQLKKTNKYNFETMNSIYSAEVINNSVKLEMTEVSEDESVDLSSLSEFKNKYFINVGVPHLVLEVEDLVNYDVFKNGAQLSKLKLFPKGANINFVEKKAHNIFSIRTYERGVENETLACGTGCTAAAYAVSKFYGSNESIEFKAQGGNLVVNIDYKKQQTFLTGPVDLIYQGIIEI